MITMVGRMLVWLGVACQGLLLPPLSAQEPKMRNTLKAMKCSISFLALSFIAAIAHGEGVQYSDAELHYSIKVPEGWQRLPPGVADKVTEAFILQTGVPMPKYQAWFQRSDRQVGDYPYLLINRQICQTPTLDELAASMKKNKEKMASSRAQEDSTGVPPPA